VKVLMLVQSPVAGDARVLRESATLAGVGHDVYVVGRDVPAGFSPPPGVTVESVERVRGLRPASKPRTDSRPIRAARWLLLPEHRAWVERAWARGAERLLAAHPRADVVHAHDFNTLELAAALVNRWNARLIYDAHELWFGRALPGRPATLSSIRGAALELRLAERAQTVLTVSEGIAGRFRSRGLSDVRVVRNTFPPDDSPSVNLPSDPRGIVYAGRIGPGRDLETIVRAGPPLKPLRIVVLGPFDAGYRLQHADDVDMLSSMPVSDVDRVYREFGIAVVPLTDSCENHRLALPNKLFHAVRAGVPVVTADLPELRGVVERYRLGALYRPGDPADLTRAVREVVSNFRAFREAVKDATPELTWSRDEAVLLEVYAGLNA